jgi:hypothetical protein
MSKEIFRTKGDKENNIPFADKHKKADINIISFSGGKKRGAMIQISLDNDYIQLDKPNVGILRDALNKWLKEDI